MSTDEPNTKLDVREILDEVIAAHANQIGTHYESCYLRHAGCLVVRLRDELGLKPTASAAPIANDEKHELIAEARAASSNPSRKHAYELIDRLAYALEVQEEAIRAAKEDAWEKGYDAFYRDSRRFNVSTPNPYSQELIARDPE